MLVPLSPREHDKSSSAAAGKTIAWIKLLPWGQTISVNGRHSKPTQTGRSKPLPPALTSQSPCSMPYCQSMTWSQMGNKYMVCGVPASES